AEQIRKDRKPVSSNNPFVAMQEQFSNQIVSAFDSWRDTSEKLTERTFLAVYGSPVLQAAVGIDPSETQRLRKAPKNPLHGELLQKRIEELKSRIPVGGPRAAVIRALIYAGMNRAAIDERGFEMARRIRETHSDMSIADFKALVREQFNILLIDQEAALAAIPSMLPPDAQTREKAYGMINQLMNARGEPTAEDKKRMSEIARLFGLGSSPPSLREVAKKPQAKASLYDPGYGIKLMNRNRHRVCLLPAALLLLLVDPEFAAAHPSCPDPAVPIASLLMPPPKHDSAQTRAELQELLRLQESRTSQQIEHVKGDDHRTVERFLGGMNIKVGQLSDSAIHFFDCIGAAVEKAVRDAKTTFIRTRPYRLHESKLRTLKKLSDRDSTSY